MAQKGVQLDTESSVSAAAEEDVTAAVSELTDQLQTVSLEAAQPDGLLPPEPETPEPETPEAETPEPETPEPETPEPETPEPESRADFLRCSRRITLDPNTAHRGMLLSEGNRKVTCKGPHQPYPDHPERFTNRRQVLSRESLTGRCYLEVELRGGGRFSLAVAYKNISREGDESEFGSNDKSWALYCYGNSTTFMFKSIETPLSVPPPRVGVYLDHRAGILSFYRVSETMTLLCKVQENFEQPLYVGLWVHLFGSSAELCEPR